MRRRVAAILNPVSGRRNALRRVNRVGELLHEQGCELDILRTNGVGHATELARHETDGAEAILAVGGDGTLNEVINGLADRSTPVVAWGTGTENLLATELGMPRDAAGVARALLTGEPFPFDLGVLNGRRFAAVAGIGFDAECVQRVSRTRRGHISYRDYFWPLWRTFWAHRFPPLRVEVDGACVFEGTGLALIGNIARYSVGLRLLPHARYDDGLLDVCVMPCASRTGLLAHAVSALRGRHVGRGGVVYCHGREVVVSSSASVPVELDGELAGVLPATCTILPRVLTLLR